MEKAPCYGGILVVNWTLGKRSRALFVNNQGHIAWLCVFGVGDRDVRPAIKLANDLIIG
jgi:hypothetical protein